MIVKTPILGMSAQLYNDSEHGFAFDPIGNEDSNKAGNILAHLHPLEREKRINACMEAARNWLVAEGFSEINPDSWKPMRLDEILTGPWKGHYKRLEDLL